MRSLKLMSLVSSLMLLCSAAFAGSFGMGVTGGLYTIDTDGTETLRESGNKTSKSISEDVAIPEIFVEYVADNGAAFGLAYIPAEEIGNKSRTDSNSDGDSGTYKAAAEIDNHVMAYVDVPVYSALYVTGGLSRTTIVTNESLNSGSSYANQDVWGYTLGLGVKGDVPLGDGLYYKLAATYTDFESYESTAAGSASNKINADVEATALKLSLGYKF